MSSGIKPIILHNHASGPNPPKVAIMLEELGLPYESKWIDFGVIKQEPYINLNSNGRVPTIEDPNTGITLWESGAIIDYLIETYDKDAKFHYTTSPEKFHQRQWAAFQMSGQGPYFGQLTWFSFFHPEKIPNVIERYTKEVRRVLSVIELHLTRSGQDYLVGDKPVYCDFMFITWNALPPRIIEGFDWKAEFPKSFEWHERLVSRPAVKTVFERQAKAKEEGH